MNRFLLTILIAPALLLAAGEPGFVPLFNGKNLDGWTLKRGSGRGYVVENGVIVCPKDGGGNLLTNAEFADFVFRFEFKLDEGSNNGVGIRAPWDGDIAYTGMEIQILDHDAPVYKGKLKPAQHHGSVYDVVAAKPAPFKPLGQWNEEEIRAVGRRITVVLNGTTILDTDLSEVTDPAVLKRHPGLLRKGGHIGFLGHNSHVEFRNIRVKSLDAKPFHEAELIIPMEKIHNHASSIVELPGGELLVCWYHGSGERTADDVKVEGARLAPGFHTWSERFTLADTPGFPDTNPVMFLDTQKRVWLIWQTILANKWETALTRYRISSDYRNPGPPKWEFSDDILFIPRNFEARVKEAIARMPAGSERLEKAKTAAAEHAADKYFTRMGWMTRVHPLQLPSGRILVPLYSDGFSFSLVGISDDKGVSWTSSEPMVSAGGVQPSIVRKKDGTLVAYMRDNGPPPKRVLSASSKDDGVTWSEVVDTDIPNPGSSLEVISLKDGSWLMINNDTEKARDSLVAALSDDEGRTWKWQRHLEKGTGSYHYPSVMQADDGSIHATYSYYAGQEQAIKHAQFNTEWIKVGD